MARIRYCDASRRTSRSVQTGAAAFASLQEAKDDPFGVVVMEGEFGGTIYLTCPVADIRCSEAELLNILAILDELDYDDPDGRRLVFERHDLPTNAAGDADSSIDNHLWLGQEYEVRCDASSSALSEAIASVLRGERRADSIEPLVDRSPGPVTRSRLTRSDAVSRPGVLSRDGKTIELG